MLFSSEHALKMGVIGQNLLYAGTIYLADSNRFKLVAKPYCVRKLFRSANSNRFKLVANLTVYETFRSKNSNLVSVDLQQISSSVIAQR